MVATPTTSHSGSGEPVALGDSPTVLPHRYITAVVTRNVLLLAVHATVTLWTVVLLMYCPDVLS